MAEVLTGYLGETARLPFTWGVHDCATFVLRWLDRQTGIAGAAAWFGRYSDEATCDAFIAAHGGYEAIADDFLWRHYKIERGRSDAANPVFVKFKDRTAFGLRVSPSQIVLRTLRGVVITQRATVLAEWGAA